MPITKDQAAHLNQRIQNRYGEVRYRKRDAKPATVTRAEAIVQAWEALQSQKSKEHDAKTAAAKIHAQEVVLAGDWQTALAVVKKFETATY